MNDQRPIQTRRFEPAYIVAGMVVFAAAISGLRSSQPPDEGRFERTLAVSGAAEIDVSTGAGSITVRTGAAATVHVVGIVKARRFLGRDAGETIRSIVANPPIESAGNVVRIRPLDNDARHKHLSVSYELTVPPDSRLRARTGSGSQSVEGIGGPAEVSTGSGSIDMRDIGASVRAETGSGDIELDRLGGDVRASTGSGSITARRVARDFAGNTGSGSVRVDGATGTIDIGSGSGSVWVEAVRGSLRVHTGSGEITAAGEPTGEWKLSTSSGGIRVRLPADAAFDLDAHSGSGGISVNHPVILRGKVSRNEVSGPVRGGGVPMRLRTSSGGIRVD